MGTKVIVNSNSPNRVSISGQQRSSVRTVGVGFDQINNLSELKDVDASNADNNEVLVYDETLNKYVIKTIPSVDGGTF
jgi:peroxiredoxin